MATECAALLQILLVVFLGAPKGRSSDDLRRDRFREPFLSSEALDRGFCSGFLFRRVIENDAPILCAPVRTLAVQLRWVVEREKGIEKLFVGDPGGIVVDLDGFGMAGAVGADVLVGRVGHCAALVSDGGGGDSGKLRETGFDTPETSGGKCGFGHGDLSHQFRFCTVRWGITALICS